MSSTEPAPVLIVGGSGVVGSLAARTLRRLQPRLPITIAGRNLAKATEVAESLGRADAVVVDLDRPDLGLPAERPFSAIVMFLKDDSLNTLRFAQRRGIAYQSVSTGSFEMAPEVARFIHQPQAAPMLLQSHWLAGAASLPTLHFAQEFESIDRIDLGVVLDEQDMGGPAAAADYERLTTAAPHALVLENRRWTWATEANAKRRFTGVDGRVLEGTAYAPFDGLSLAAVTGAADIRLDLVVGESAARRRGAHFSTEIVIELQGRLKDGTAGRTRHEIVHPQGQAPLTALFVAMGAERLLGLAGGPAVAPGLYLPDVLIAPAAAIAGLHDIGATVTRA